MTSRININKYETFLGYFKEGILYYEDARVWRTKRVNSCKKIVLLESSVLAGNQMKTGYRRVHFNKIDVYEHLLIYAYFNGVDSLKTIECIDHLNGVKDDNRLENLEGVSIKENNERAKVNGLLRPLRGECNGSAKLTDLEVELIKELYMQDVTQYRIAEIAKISQGHVSGIVRGKKRATSK